MSRGALKLDLSLLDVFWMITSLKWVFKKLFKGKKISINAEKKKNVHMEQVRVCKKNVLITRSIDANMKKI